MKDNSNGAVEIDIFKLIRLLWSKIIWILLAAAFLGMAGYCFARFFISPSYEANAWFYVNNNAVSVSDSSYNISTSQLSGARSLVDTYAVVLSSRNTMNAVIEEGNLPYSPEKLNKMVTCSAVNDTEMFSVTVTANNPQEALLIARTISEVLPGRISDIVDNSSVRVVDEPKLPDSRSGPSYTKYAIIGAFIGALIAGVAVFLQDLFDVVIHTDDFLTANYDVPILARIPDLAGSSSQSGYYESDYSATATKEDKRK